MMWLHSWWYNSNLFGNQTPFITSHQTPWFKKDTTKKVLDSLLILDAFAVFIMSSKNTLWHINAGYNNIIIVLYYYLSFGNNKQWIWDGRRGIKRKLQSINKLYQGKWEMNNFMLSSRQNWQHTTEFSPPSKEK